MKFRIFASVLLPLCLISAALAQRISGSIRGSVIDPSGAVVQRAQVSAQHTETGLVRSVATNKDGVYLIVELPVGHYLIEVEAKGFRKYVQEGISVDVNEAVNVPIKLSVGTESQQVQVTAEGQLIQSTVTSLGKVVSEREVVDLPLNGRNFSQLGTLQPRCYACDARTGRSGRIVTRRTSLRREWPEAGVEQFFD